MSLLKAVVDRFWNIWYPRHCPYCDEITENNEIICPKCLSELNTLRLDKNCCIKCGLPKTECSCKKKVFLFNGVVAPFMYRRGAKLGILNIKKMKSIENAEFYADYMAETVGNKYKDIKFDYITNVPMFLDDERKKGFNHSEILAKLLAKRLGIKYHNTLKQIAKHRRQHELGYKDRIKNVKGIYKMKKRVSVEGMNILLVDDIKTSGASLNECARVLRIAGAEGVWCVCAAITCKKSL